MLTDRSRITTYQRCPRLRYLTYHLGGRGLVPVESAYELQFGIAYHDAISALWRAVRTDTDPDPDARIIDEAWGELSALLVTPPTPQFLPEQEALFKGLLWAWVLVRRPLLQERYELVLTEREFLWDMGAGITLMVRLDTLIRERISGELYYLEQKTTAWGNDKWELTFEHNAQVMAGLLACEQALSEMPAAVLVEGHVKGSRRADTSLSSPFAGSTFQDSPLCYVWQLPDGSVSLKWMRGGTRAAVWTFATAREWVTTGLGASERESLFRVLMPIRPDRRHLDRWLRQTVLQEARISISLEQMSKPGVSDGEIRGELDTTFPLHESACHDWGRRCSHWAFCHDTMAAQNPLATPGFAPRTPHHPAETVEDGEA